MMKAKNLIIIVAICAILSGCGVAEDTLQDTLNVKGEPLEVVSLEKSTEKSDGQSEKTSDIEEKSNYSEITGDVNIGVEDSGDNSVKVQDYNVGETRYDDSDYQKTEQSNTVKDSNLGEKTIGAVKEGCYDDPNNPVKDQDYSVGEPRNEQGQPVDEINHGTMLTTDYPTDILEMHRRISDGMILGKLSFVYESVICENPLRIEVTVGNIEESQIEQFLSEYDPDGKYVIVFQAH